MVELQNKHQSKNILLTLIDLQLQNEGNKMRQRIRTILDKHLDKIQHTILLQEDMQRHRQKTFDSMEGFFEELKKKIASRCDALKEEYKLIEGREKRRLKNR